MAREFAETPVSGCASRMIEDETARNWLVDIEGATGTDFDADGARDTLLFEYRYANRGTLRVEESRLSAGTSPTVHLSPAPCGPYTVTNLAPSDLTEPEADRCVAIITSGGAVDVFGRNMAVIINNRLRFGMAFAATLTAL